MQQGLMFWGHMILQIMKKLHQFCCLDLLAIFFLEHVHDIVVLIEVMFSRMKNAIHHVPHHVAHQLEQSFGGCHHLCWQAFLEMKLFARLAWTSFQGSLLSSHEGFGCLEVWNIHSQSQSQSQSQAPKRSQNSQYQITCKQLVPE